jgi:hypothetical protein
MGSDFSVILHQTAHLGNEPGVFGTAPFKGPTFDSPPFSCPNVDPSQRAVLMFQTRSVHAARNVIRINGSDLFGGIPVSTTGSAESPIWNGNVLLVEANVLKESGNVLHLEARNVSGGGGGNIEDFLIDNAVILFKTR